MSAFVHFSDTAGQPGSLAIPTDGGSVRIGRREDCDIQFPEENISRLHATISWTGDRFRIRDLGSANGTRVDGRRVAEVDLVSGMRISIGDHELRFSTDPERARPAPETLPPRKAREAEAPPPPPPIPAALRQTEGFPMSMEAVQKAEVSLKLAQEELRGANQRIAALAHERGEEAVALRLLGNRLAGAEAEALRLRGELSTVMRQRIALDEAARRSREECASFEERLEGEQRRRQHEESISREVGATLESERAQRVAAEARLRSALAAGEEAERHLEEQQAQIQRLTTELRGAVETAGDHDGDARRAEELGLATARELLELQALHAGCLKERAATEARFDGANQERLALAARCAHLTDENQLLHRAIPLRRQEVARLTLSFATTLETVKTLATAVAGNREVREQLLGLVRQGLAEVQSARRSESGAAPGEEWRPRRE